MNFFKSMLSFKGIPLRHAMTEREVFLLRQSESVVNDDERKWGIFQFHREYNPFFRDFINGSVIREWTDIPILEKNHIQRPLTQLVSTGIRVKDCYRNNTSGSTGKPLHFAKDKFCHAMTWAFIFDAYKGMGLEYGNSLQARFFGIPRSATGYMKEKMKDVLSARVRFSVFDLSDRKLREYLLKFSTSKFEYLYGYTSSLVLFAEFISRQGMILKQVCPSLRWCIVTSEVCSVEDRKLLTEAFGVPVRNEYGAAELDIIAFEDGDGDWILNDDNLYIEIVSPDGQLVSDGQAGNVVVTALYNRAMPFIRYNLGDVLSISTERKGRLRKIKSMEGRINDIAVLPSGKKAPGLTFYYISKSLLLKGGFLKEFTIKQIAIDHFHFEYIAECDLSSAQKLKVQRIMDLYLEPGLKATFERKLIIERKGAGKFKHFHNLISSGK